MDNLETLIHLLFKRVSSQQVLKGCISYDSFDKAEFLRLQSSYIFYYSENEASNLLDYYCNAFQGNARAEGRKVSGDLNVFEALFYCAKRFLSIKNNEVLCRYSSLLEWRKVALELDEDMFIAAFLASRLSESEMMDMGFCWKRVLGHDNEQLNTLVGRGISENHFHLNGSAPVFHVSWLGLMNNINSSQFGKILAAYDKNRQYTNALYTSEYSELPFYQRIVQAALIRILLYSTLSGRHMRIGTYYEETRQIYGFFAHPLFDVEGGATVFSQETAEKLVAGCKRKKGEYTYREIISLIIHELYGSEESNFWNHNPGFANLMKKNIGSYTLDVWKLQDCLQSNSGKTLSEVFEKLLMEIPMIDMEDAKELFADGQEQFFYELWDERTLKNVKALLQRPEELMCYVSDIQSVIDSYKMSGMPLTGQERTVDYMLQELSSNVWTEEEGDFVFSGERRLMYMMFRQLYSHESAFAECYNLFYAYLLIKESVRSEMLQTNRNVGFRNFQKYEKRKTDFLADEIYRNAFVRTAVSGSMLKKGLERLEIRMTPQEDTEQNRRMLVQTDSLLDPERRQRSRFFYTLHFIKQPEDPKNMDCFYCRHHKLRKRVEKQAFAISGLREKYPIVGERVLGIDAASNEIGCRPEVFAVVFRYLRGHRSCYMTPDGIKKLPQLHTTYHVGEDFLDLADGLRAIEEAVRFLNMKSGDRLGHALALGIDVNEWYVSKNYEIALPVQDYLDNLVWIYHKLIEYDIAGYENLKEWILSEFTVLFHDIYSSNITQSELECIRERSGNMDGTLSFDGNINIFSYYYAWQLRGDDPELYEFGFFDERKYIRTMQEFRVNKEYPENYELRCLPAAALVYYLYHYNENVRIRGRATREVHISKSYIRAVAEIQIFMQKQIAARGIAIETNPSSNYLIGTFRQYEKHPIIRFYNKGLIHDPERLEKCSQILVSVNTDDQGVFHTSLENEYALLARALESVTDENDRPLYNKGDIYEWLDRIRIMGNEQSFGYLAEKKTDR